ncbi:MAG: hypothetical protein FD165_55 [Gammaproteobacteria bacterium]|nr:MAG: hypothetical protein FD165_55 [Gammaproteobacteria bacterium]TND06633.1 MAG: hypothetical protein FD120_365 [Gammaproteobacteria bacterium]
MVFDYYQKLTPPQQRVYRASDQITLVRLNDRESLIPVVAALGTALAAAHRANTQKVCQKLAQALSDDLKIRRLNVRVLSARPHDSNGELHGMYEPRHGVKPGKITLWMRTARQQRVVAFRTFLRTFLHEFGHHLDYELLKLADSFHTEGFFKRESSLFRQLVPRKKTIRKPVQGRAD